MKQKIRVYLTAIVLTLGVGALSGLLSMRGMQAYSDLQKPTLSPPGAVFPVVWTLLYLLMGIGAARVWLTGPGRRTGALRLYAAQLVINGLWSILFFALGLRFFAFLWLLLLWVFVLAMIRAFCQLDHPAGLMQVPYLLWVSFAGYLNLAIWLLNR